MLLKILLGFFGMFKLLLLRFKNMLLTKLEIGSCKFIELEVEIIQLLRFFLMLFI